MFYLIVEVFWFVQFFIVICPACKWYNVHVLFYISDFTVDQNILTSFILKDEFEI